MHAELPARIAALASEFPDELLEKAAQALIESDAGEWQTLRLKALAASGHPAFRAAMEGFLAWWQTNAAEVAPESVALALRSTAQTAEEHRAVQSVDLVWTGPESDIIPLRRSEQALVQLINEAQERLLIVSFAVYKATAVIKALVRALERGVQVDICLEMPDVSEGKIAYDAIANLGEEVAQRARFYVWPSEQRIKTQDGKHGSLHAKVAVADSELLFISSANLTEYAMNVNMEMGVLIRGGDEPGQVVRHFRRLMEMGVLKRVRLG